MARKTGVRVLALSLIILATLIMIHPNSVGAKGYKVGYNYFGNAGVLITLGNNSKYVIEAFGGTAIGIDDNFSVDKIVTDLENLIASGVDGLVVWTPTPTLFPIISQMCLEAKVPFVLSDKIPQDKALREQLRKNPYFVGGVAPKNEDYGKAIAEYALKQGWKTCIVNTSQPGDPSDQPRLDAFRKIFEAKKGKILDIVHSSGTDGGKAQLENSLIAHPNPDFIYGVGSSFGIGAVRALEKYNYRTKVVTSGLEEEVLNLLSQGKIAMANGDQWISGTFAAILLQNYLDGNRLLDENKQAPIVDNVGFYAITPQQVNIYRKFFIDEHPYSIEEIRSMSGRDFTYKDFLELVNGYSLESRMAQKVKEGKITAKELAAVGIKVKL